MNGIQKVIKYCTIAFAIALSLMIIVGCLQAILFVANIADMGEIGTETIDFTKEWSKEEAGELNEITVSAGAEIRLKSGDRLRVEGSNLLGKCEATLENGVLSISIKDDSDFSIIIFDFSWHKSVLTVTVPTEIDIEKICVRSGSDRLYIEEISTKNLTVKSSSGRVHMEEVSLGEFHLDSGSGRVEIVDSALGETDIQSGSGRVEFRNVSGNNATIRSGSGRVEFTGRLLGNTKIDSGSGRVSLKLQGNKEDYRIRVNSGSGNFYLDGKKYNDLETGVNKEGDIYIVSGSGRFCLDFVK